MGEEPVVADLIEAASNVAFENPLWVCLPQGEITLLHRIRTGSSLSETVRVPVSSGFHNRVQSEKVECLHRSVLHCGDGRRELHLSTVSIWDGPRSVTHSIRCAVDAFQCSKSDASLAMTLSFFVDWIVALSASRWSGPIGLILRQGTH